MAPSHEEGEDSCGKIPSQEGDSLTLWHPSQEEGEESCEETLDPQPGG